MKAKNDTENNPVPAKNLKYTDIAKSGHINYARTTRTLVSMFAKVV